MCVPPTPSPTSMGGVYGGTPVLAHACTRTPRRGAPRHEFIIAPFIFPFSLFPLLFSLIFSFEGHWAGAGGVMLNRKEAFSFSGVK